MVLRVVAERWRSQAHHLLSAVERGSARYFYGHNLLCSPGTFVLLHDFHFSFFHGLVLLFSLVFFVFLKFVFLSLTKVYRVSRIPSDRIFPAKRKEMNRRLFRPIGIQ